MTNDALVAQRRARQSHVPVAGRPPEPATASAKVAIGLLAVTVAGLIGVTIFVLSTRNVRRRLVDPAAAPPAAEVASPEPSIRADYDRPRARLSAPQAPPAAVAPGEAGDQNPISREETHRQELEATMTALAQSGPTTAAWTAPAKALLADWKRSAALSDDDVALSDIRCFAAGCAITATHRDLGAFMNFNRGFAGSPAFMGWRGPKFRSGPRQLPSGKVDAVWVLYAPVD